MPLKPGKGNIGQNISELKKTGHPNAQSVAIALKESRTKVRADIPDVPKVNRGNDAGRPGSFSKK